MAITITTFPWQLTYGTKTYTARVCGRSRQEDGLWEGWIEFDPTDGSPTRRSGQETTQPNLTDLEYWATGLTEIYLEGALKRVMHPAVLTRPAVAPPPVFDGPAPSSTVRSAPVPEAILDPYSVYAKSPQMLVDELRALRSWHLRQVVRAYGLADERDLNLEGMSHQELSDLIVQGVSEAARASAQTSR